MMFRSPYPNIAIPDVPFHDLVLVRAQELAGRPALIDAPTQRTITFAQLAESVLSVASSLAARGMRKGDVFAIMTPNLPEFAMAFFGVLAAGGMVTTLNPVNTEHEIAQQLNDAHAHYLLTIPQLLEKVTAIRTDRALREVFVVGQTSGATAFNTLLTGNPVLPNVDFSPSDIAVLPYSSGTTGCSKGVVLSHSNLNAGLLAVAAMIPSVRDGRCLALLPFFHVAGLMCVLAVGLYLGASLILMPRFDLEIMLRAIQDHHIQFALLVPPIVLALAKHPLVGTFDLSSLQCVFSGAAPLAPEIQRACHERLHVPVFNGYGMTEAAGATHGSTNTAYLKFGSVGPCALNVQCKIVDIDTGAELGPNQQGELWIRGPQVMQGYLNNPEATARCLDSEGWYHTGDIAYADPQGCFYIVDRLKELIKYKAYQIAPAELEAVLVTHPAVAEAAVIPVPNEEVGEVPKAFVVLKGSATVEDILSFVAQRVAPYKKIHRLEFVEQIPKTPAGKLLRRVLRERELSVKSETRH